MDRQHITNELIRIFSSEDHLGANFDSSQLTEETSLIHDLGLESIRILNLVVDIENCFQITLKTEGSIMDLFDRFGNLLDFIAAKKTAAVS